MSTLTVRTQSDEEKGRWPPELGSAGTAAVERGERSGHGGVLAGSPGQLRLQLSTGSATLVTVVPDRVESVWIAQSENYLVVEGTSLGNVLNVDLANRKWLQVKWSHFARVGREQRIAKALAALDRASVSYDLDAQTVEWIAEDPDLEDF